MRTLGNLVPAVVLRRGLHMPAGRPIMYSAANLLGHTSWSAKTPMEMDGMVVGSRLETPRLRSAKTLKADPARSSKLNTRPRKSLPDQM